MANIGVMGRIFQRKPVELIHAETDHGELKRTLGALNLTLLGIGLSCLAIGPVVAIGSSPTFFSASYILL